VPNDDSQPVAHQASSRPTISTHVLDTGSGRPAAGIHVTLSKLGDDGRPIRMTQALTDDDGRIRDLLERPLSAGTYRLEFSLGGPATGEGRDAVERRERFFERVSLDLRVEDTARSYHVPLLLAPYAITSYRGS
jgi:5-hydroxyisourate hydrolase